jgi:hypothetical protein
MTRVGRDESLRLLEAAFDAGLTHYDVARSYGYGEAESALGDFLARRRDEVTVTTKLGLEPPPRSRGLAFAKLAARKTVAAAPPLRRLARRGAAHLVKSGRFAVADARLSLEASLRELRTDYVDLLLLHECRPEDLSEELLEFLRSSVRAGRVRAFGIATQVGASRAIVAGSPEFARVVQVGNSVTAAAVDSAPELWRSGVITHSALEGLDAVHRHVTESGDRASRWSSAVGADCSDRGVLASLMLSWACFANATGVVLFSSRHTANIRANAAIDLSQPRNEQAARLAGLVQKDVAAASSGPGT